MSFLDIDLASHWEIIVIVILAVAILIESFFLLRKRRKDKSSELQPVINDIRKVIRQHHVAERKIFKELDYVLSEIPAYIGAKVAERREP